ncbi:hypothetical protein NM208_g7734 [Fusarium decemcellulare]|uniref:Uncharacterized protein n=1 Tax=Fusarium decemcellulare TaxID=57161 RepID=A0ACC1S7W5_9HYPO|nr:hypothetical protein NM208_g7734 [Fusarium decemcellulare]
MSNREVRATQRRLMAKYGIEFLGPVDSLKENDQPSPHVTVVSHVRQLGRTQFSQYHDNITIDSNEQPWRGQMRRRAERIASLARMCLKGRKNEMGWRLTLESEVMARFTVEVSCRRCRGRLWRSEQEAAPKITDENITTWGNRDLQARQQKRKACMCRSLRHREDHTEQGIGPLFDDRADEAIVYDEEVRSQLPKREERPDRVYGLRRTKRLDRILCMDDKRLGSDGKTIEETLPTTPFRDDGEAIILPFLVLEAKSEKGGDSFTDMEVQTAFAIRQILLLQHGLYQAADEHEDEGSGPLVWFLSNKGEQWRVAIGYVDSNGNSPRFLVTRLWSGAVDSVDASVQLLLIIDYICDWARDIYRESVINSLRALIAGDSRSLAYDSDIFSLAAGIYGWDQIGDGEQKSMSEGTPSNSFEDPLKAFDMQKMAFRDARYLRSRFVALYVTADNIDPFIQSAESKNHAKRLAQSILVALRGAWRVKKECLDELEAMWTGVDRGGSDMLPPDTRFLAVFTISSYMSADWQQTFELGYIAVAEDLVDTLVEIRDNGSRPGQDLPQFPTVPGQVVKETFEGMRSQYTPTEILQACIGMECFTTSFKSRKRKAEFDMRTVHSIEQPGSRVDGLFIPDKTGKTHTFINKWYQRHKIGRQEPTSSVVRVSKLWAKRSEVPQPEDSDLWIVITGYGYKNDAACAFILNPPPVMSSLSLLALIKRSVTPTRSKGFRRTVPFRSTGYGYPHRNLETRRCWLDKFFFVDVYSHLREFQPSLIHCPQLENSTSSPDAVVLSPNTQTAFSGTREDPIIMDVPSPILENSGTRVAGELSHASGVLVQNTSEITTTGRPSTGSQTASGRSDSTEELDYDGVVDVSRESVDSQRECYPSHKRPLEETDHNDCSNVRTEAAPPKPKKGCTRVDLL